MRFLWCFFFVMVAFSLGAQVGNTSHYNKILLDSLEMTKLSTEELKMELDSAIISGEENQALMDRLKKENEKLKVILQQYNEQVEQRKKETISNDTTNQIPPMAIQVEDKDTGEFRWVTNAVFLNQISRKTADTIEQISSLWNEPDRKRLNKNGE